MIKRFRSSVYYLLVGVIFLSGCLVWLSARQASAAFNKNLLITDSIFSNYGSMTSLQIDSFLNTFPSSCISTKAKFTAPDPTGYNPTNGFLYGGNVSAGRVIYDSAQAYGLNPQVIIATLQKEQSLVSGTAGCSTLRYVGAMGYGCPDSGTTHSYTGGNFYTINGHTVSTVSGTCVNSKAKAGFSQQVIHGAWLLKFGQERSRGHTTWAVIKGKWDNSDDPDTCYGGPMTKGTFKRCSNGSAVTYDGYTTIDNGSVFMGSGATATLYWYTPHIHGNQSFVSIYEGWFGSTIGLADVVHPDGALIKKPTSAAIYQVKAGQLWTYPYPQTLYSYGYSSKDVKQATDPDLDLVVGGTMPYQEGALIKGSSDAIYAIDNQSGTSVKRPFASWSVFTGLGYKGSEVMVVPDASLPSSTGSDINTVATTHPDGTIVQVSGQPTVYLIQDGAKLAFPSPEVLFSQNYTWSDIKTATSADSGLADGSQVKFREGTLLKTGATVYVVDQLVDGSLQKRAIANLNTFYGLGYSFYKVVEVSSSALPTSNGATVGP